MEYSNSSLQYLWYSYTIVLVKTILSTIITVKRIHPLTIPRVYSYLRAKNWHPFRNSYDTIHRMGQTGCQFLARRHEYRKNPVNPLSGIGVSARLQG
ncbi:hypothetical protein L873DRAFT_452537 [Choiromyces venosus 120613-1]|uniref:Uncharacterized protein n=1 Tax=Choiromyces venosus 120613-1 TaxID=1336337 RepID=A0A3N4K8P6_9PEZI|nr:hypothetical protein L873DRAFT_452537 [Choiromyces venosus 120613-1]